MSEEIQQAISSLEPEVVISVKDQLIPLVQIPAGEFDMGSAPDEVGREDTEGPIRHIVISQPFYIGRFEITQEQYMAVMGENIGRFEGENLAIDQLTIPKSHEFCKRLSDITGVTITLPTEAQWEYACRAGSAARYYIGNEERDLENVAWYRANSDMRIHRVGQKEPNAFGLYDMLGNVWEVCLDSLADYSGIEATDPVGSVSEEGGAMRGGAWMDEAERVRCASSLESNQMFGGMGMRIVINP